jgi:hypothetical protein
MLDLLGSPSVSDEPLAVLVFGHEVAPRAQTGDTHGTIINTGRRYWQVGSPVDERLRLTYNSEIRSYVPRLGSRSSDSVSRYSRTLTPTNQGARQTLGPSRLRARWIIPGVRGQGWHVRSLERAEDARSGHFVTRAARSLERGGPSVRGMRKTGEYFPLRSPPWPVPGRALG